MIKDSTIFVSVASYRDPETSMTVNDMLSKATYPERIFVGILSQIDRRVESKYLAPFGRRIRQEVMDYRDSKGVCWARSRILTKLREREEYVLQIDSHSRFKPGWDVTVLSMYERLDNNSTVISHYPPNYTPGKEINYNDNPFIYFTIKELSEPGIPRYSSGILPRVDRAIKHCGTIGVAGGCLFGHRSVFDRVPYDPYLYFFGEEPSYALRLYTHGIDIYSPTESFMYHYYNIMNKTHIKDRTLHWEDHEVKVNNYNRVSFDRLRYLFKLEPIVDKGNLIDIQNYSLGKHRTLEQWQAKLGIDLKTKYISDTVKNKIFY